MGIKKGRVIIKCRGIIKGRWHKRSGGTITMKPTSDGPSEGD